MPTGLVLEGGGMRGWYTGGVLTVLKENDISFPTVYGISAGALNALPYISGQICEEYVHSLLKCMVDRCRAGAQNFNGAANAFGLDFLFGELFHDLVPFNYDAFFDSPTELKAGTTDLKTGAVHFSGKAEMDENFRAIRASCSLPMVSDIVAFQGRNLLDGGCADPIPAEYAIADGNDKIMIVLTRDAAYRKSSIPEYPLSALRERYGEYPEFIHTMMRRPDVYNGELKYCSQLEREGRAVVVRPSIPIEFDRYETDRLRLQEVYELGMSDCMARLSEIRSFLNA